MSSLPIVIGQAGLLVYKTQIDAANGKLSKGGNTTGLKERKSKSPTAQLNDCLLPALTIDSDKNTAPELAVGEFGAQGNWEIGYGCRSDHPLGQSQVLDSILEALDRRLDGASKCAGFTLLFSTAGGTGAGLGSRLALELKDRYTDKLHTIAFPILPFDRGESLLQSYNTTLALGAMHMHSDAVVMIRNDHLREAVVHDGMEPSMTALNRTARRMLQSILWPTHDTQSHSVSNPAECSVEPFSGWDLINHSFSVPQCKFAHCATSGPFHPQLFPDALKALIYNLRMPPVRKPSCLAATAYISEPFIDHTFKSQKFQSKLHQRLQFTSTNPAAALDLRISCPDTESRLTLVHNTGALAIDTFSRLLDGTLKMYKKKAFLHHYQHASSWILEAHEHLQRVCDEYAARMKGPV